MAIKYGAGGLSMHKLRVTDKQRRGLQREFVPKGALVNDEWSQDASMLYHGYALRSTYARAPYYNLDVSRYAERDQSFGAVAIMLDAGDELQLPPVPETASMLAPVEGRSDEHVAGVRIFKERDYVCRLTTAMRFTDDVLVRILQKMRTVGGTPLTPGEWQKLLDTEVASRAKSGGTATLQGTELWYHAAYGWSVIAMTQVIRSRLSAKAAHATLYVVQAEDSILNMPPGDMSIDDATQLILRHPNMNDTGRLPAVALLHLGMRVRLTVTIEGAAVDSIGIIVGIDLHPTDAAAAETRDGEAVRLLREMPSSVLVKLDDSNTELLPPRPCAAHQDTTADRGCPNCRFYGGHIAVEPRRCRSAFHIDVEWKGTEYKLKVIRRQVPLTSLLASSLYTLQGATAEPGLIFHWRFPRRMSKDMRWLVVYVALSRVPSLNQLRSIGLGPNIREIIEKGPPEGLPARFRELFGDKERETIALAEKALAELGW